MNRCKVVIMRVTHTLIFLLLSCGLGADVPQEQQAEVEHLINYLQDSGCEMVRNGKAYEGVDGASHVRRKYQHFKKKISSTEEFIEYSATNSMISGRYYEVRCPGKDPERSQDWLLRELQALRGL